MAEEGDDTEKTEAPSQRRLDDARQRGQVPASREVASFFLIAAAALLWAMMTGNGTGSLGRQLRGLLADAHRLTIDDGAAGSAALAALADAAGALALPALALIAAAVGASAVQNAVVWTSETLRPKLERISPLAGAKRLFSAAALAELLKSLAKIALAAAACGYVLWSDLPTTVRAVPLGPGRILARLEELGLRLLVATAVCAALIAGADWLWQRFKFMQEMRMSRRDLQDEHKQSEGDPVIRHRLKALRMERVRRRMMAEVPKSTVVVTNPTHFSVALRYDGAEGGAPTVVAKGVDHLALKIREVAEAHGVPVVESPPLARALYGTVEIGRAIAPEHYRAVAEIIGFVLRQKARP